MSSNNGKLPPLIGVTTSEVRRSEQVEQTFQGEPPRHEMALGLTYLRAVEKAGGIPVVIPPLGLEAIDPLLDRLNGICLSGGPDIDPKTYGAEAHPEVGPTEPELDLFELAIARAADRREIPILAICRGAQALNISRGGTLVQHVPDLPDVEGSAHRQKEPGDVATHRVEVEPASLLGGILGSPQVEVNSFHHQASEEIGEGLVPVAWSEDGVVEGLEDPKRPFLLGVQWHAETLVDRPEELALFEALVEASRNGAS